MGKKLAKKKKMRTSQIQKMSFEFQSVLCVPRTMKEKVQYQGRLENTRTLEIKKESPVVLTHVLNKEEVKMDLSLSQQIIH